MITRTVTILFGLVVLLVAEGVIQARDVVTVTSDKTAVVDRNKGTAVWQKNVRVHRESTGSNLLSDQLSIRRDPHSGRIAHANANGNVRVVYFNPVETDRQQDPGESTAPTTITCERLTFDRKTAILELSGKVQVRDSDFELEAERVRYNYQEERGKISALPGEQVRFVIYKRPGPEDARRDPNNPEKGKLTGAADEILIDRPGRKSVLQGTVEMEDHSDQSRFKAQRAELFFNDAEEITTIVADGNFSMNQPKRLSRAERAVFEYLTEEVTLIGNAYVKEDNNMEISSARIKMYMKVDRGIISGVDDVPVKMKIEIK